MSENQHKTISSDLIASEILNDLKCVNTPRDGIWEAEIYHDVHRMFYFPPDEGLRRPAEAIFCMLFGKAMNELITSHEIVRRDTDTRPTYITAETSISNMNAKKWTFFDIIDCKDGPIYKCDDCGVDEGELRCYFNIDTTKALCPKCAIEFRKKGIKIVCKNH